MPELPEVETIVRDLRPNVVGRRVEQVDLIRESVVRFPDPASFRSRLRARRIASVATAWPGGSRGLALVRSSRLKCCRSSAAARSATPMRAVSVRAGGQSRKAGRSHCAATTASKESSSTPIVAASRTRSGVARGRSSSSARAACNWSASAACW